MTHQARPRPFTLDELRAYLVEIFPEVWKRGDLRIEDIAPMAATLRLVHHPRHLRPGGTISGPAMFALCDVALYVAILGEIGWRERQARHLDLFARVCTAQGQPAEAVTIWTAFQSRVDAGETRDMPLWVQRRAEPLRRAIAVLGPDRAQAARERGTAMTVETAVEFALMSIGSAPASPPAPVLNRLSSREQELVSLVAKGRTDAQIAGQLYISVSTVRSHLDRIRDKTSCRRRADLTRLALQAGLA